MVVEDDPAMRNLISSLLEVDGFSVTPAGDVESALQMCEAEMPTLIILDLMLPIRDGEAFVHEFRRRWRDEDVPVIVLSASASRKRLSRELRVAASLGKPFAPEDLIELVTAHAHKDAPN